VPANARPNSGTRPASACSQRQSARQIPARPKARPMILFLARRAMRCGLPEASVDTSNMRGAPTRGDGTYATWAGAWGAARCSVGKQANVAVSGLRSTRSVGLTTRRPGASIAIVNRPGFQWRLGMLTPGPRDWERLMVVGGLGCPIRSSPFSLDRATRMPPRATPVRNALRGATPMRAVRRGRAWRRTQ
jgi:hypothetical protein